MRVGHVDAEIHATAPVPHAPETSIWPAVLGFAVLAVGLGLVIPSVLCLAAGLLLFATGVVGLTREARATAAPGEAGKGPLDDFFGGIPKHAWLSIGFMIVSLLGFIAIFRVFVAYDLFLPEGWPPGTWELGGAPAVAATLLAAATTLPAHQGLRWTRRSEATRKKRAPLALATTGVVGLVFLIALGIEWRRLLEMGLTPTGSTAGSAYYALTGFLALQVAGAIITLAALSWWASRDPDPPGSMEPIQGAVWYWHYLVASWIAIYAIVYLRIIVWNVPNLQ